MNDIERIDRMISILRDMKKDIIRQQKLCSLTIRNAQNKFSEQPLSGFWGDGRKDKQSPCWRKTATGGIRHHHQRSLRRQIWQQ